MPITAHLDLTLKAEALPTAPAVLREILSDTRAFAGCLGVDVLVDSNDPAHFLVVEQWASLEHDSAYRAWRAGDGASGLGDILAAPPVLTHFETSFEA
ncbi:antibiotic biosynthesis monooxygenase family protein [Arthrobacter sp. AL12]|uniref:putative quinol monooxygenase n=1 Tax=Arthrobacter sp. AL12 TaxID=3042241 RepID=UPI00249B450A|nr:antibiotic biosynthesis monooxygenase family protein [Arthrobacter sp. AL12]MDI3211668.1 antibiotic biosynthesis monooxygenase [Arthrobacter sp. AL12]